MQHIGHVVQRGDHDQLAQQIGWYRDMYRYQQLEAALDDAPERRRGRQRMRSFWTAMADAETVAGVWLAMAKPLSVAVMMRSSCGSGGG